MNNLTVMNEIISALTSDSMGLSLLNAPWYQWFLRAVVVVTGIGGSYFFLTAFMPAVKYFRSSKNTAGISRLMFTLHATVAFLFTIGGILLTTIAGFSGVTVVPHLLILGITFIVVNGSCWMGNSYIVKLKMENSKEAAAMGMSEDEHYTKVVVPRLAGK